MEIETGRLRMRLAEYTDLEDIHLLLTLPETDRYNALGIPESEKETETIITPWITDNEDSKMKNLTFVLERQSDFQFIGLLGLKRGNPKYKKGEVWFKLHPNYWNNGYATEALESIIDVGFHVFQLHRIEAGCAVDNIGSIKVMEKVGMIREGRCRQNLPLKSGWSDNFEYAILDTDEREGG